MKIAFKKRWRLVTGIGLILVLVLGWLATTDNINVWPVRNTLQYQVLAWWWTYVGEPMPGDPGTLQGTVRNAQGQPIAGAWVLVSRWDGTTYSRVGLHLRSTLRLNFSVGG